jgi:hypothetical protein
MGKSKYFSATRGLWLWISLNRSNIKVKREAFVYLVWEVETSNQVVVFLRSVRRLQLALFLVLRFVSPCWRRR